MSAKDLSILIPSRCEEFLKNTVEDIIENIEADTEVIVFLDGEWANPPLIQNDRVNIIYVPEAIGQRAGTNRACDLSRAKYVMKVDAHCSFDKGFDRKMIEGFEKVGDDVTMVPVMRNLHAFSWKCLKCGKKTYQGPRPEKCEETDYKGTGKPCTGTEFEKKLVWIAKDRPRSTSYSFDAEPHFQYFNEYTKRDEYKKDLETGFTETMSLQGSCFMLTREKFWELEISDEKLGNWGNQGVEVACKTWLSGGRVLVNHNTWYSHMFRTQKDFSFPWPASGRDAQKTKENVKNLLWDNKFDKQIYPVSWLIERFAPVKGWEDKDLAELKAKEKSNKTV